MLTQEEKLRVFLNAIDDYAEKQRSRILSELEMSNRLAVEKAEKATLDNAYEIISQRTADVRMQVSRDNAMRETEAKKELIRKRNAIEAEVFARAAEKLRAHTETSAYHSYLIRCCKKASALFGTDGNTVIFIRSEDKAFENDIISAFGKGCSVCVDESIKIGGLRFENEDSCRAIDATYDSALYAQRDRFAQTSGLKVI